MTTNIRLKCPFTAIIAGPSSSGKTKLALKIIERQTLITDCAEKFSKIFWCHGVEQSTVFDQLHKTVGKSRLQIIEGFPSLEIANGKLLRGKSPKLLVIDDLLQEVEKDATFFHLFTKISHHTNTSVIFITQVTDQ